MAQVLSFLIQLMPNQMNQNFWLPPNAQKVGHQDGRQQPKDDQESFRQTKPKKGRFMNSSRGGGKSEPRFDVNCACFPEENTRIHKKGGTSFSFRLFFGWVCRADSW